jgi:hypothetical protein
VALAYSIPKHVIILLLAKNKQMIPTNVIREGWFLKRDPANRHGITIVKVCGKESQTKNRSLAESKKNR